MTYLSFVTGSGGYVNVESKKRVKGTALLTERETRQTFPKNDVVVCIVGTLQDSVPALLYLQDE
jgi:hypothetical protein